MVPKDWKKTNITPVFRKGKKEDSGNSIYMHDKKVIRSSQHGFTNGKSCMTNPIAFYNETSIWMDEGHCLPRLHQGCQRCLSPQPHRPTQEGQTG